MTAKKILFISYHFSPSERVGAHRPTAHALKLAEKGFEVTVLRGYRQDSELLHNEKCKPIAHFINVKIYNYKDSPWVSKVKKALLKARPVSSVNHLPSAPVNNDLKNTVTKLSIFGRLVRTFRSLEALLQYEKRWLAVAFIKAAVYIVRNRDVTIIASGPPYACLVCAWLTSRISKSVLILDYRDPWFLSNDAEHNEFDELRSTTVTSSIEDFLARRCARDSTHSVGATTGISRHLIRSFGLTEESVSTIRNGFDSHSIIASAAPFGKLSMLYAGTLYLNRNPFYLLAAMEKLLSEPDIDRARIRFNMVGGCEAWSGINVQTWIDTHHLTDVVELVGTVPHAQVRALTESSNLLVNFSQGQKIQIPAKSYEYIASGRETLVICETDSDVASLFSESGKSTIVSPEDNLGMTNALRSYYQKYAMQTEDHGDTRSDISTFSREVQATRFYQLVSKSVRNTS